MVLGNVFFRHEVQLRESCSDSMMIDRAMCMFREFQREWRLQPFLVRTVLRDAQDATPRTAPRDLKIIFRSSFIVLSPFFLWCYLVYLSALSSSHFSIIMLSA